MDDKHEGVAAEMVRAMPWSPPTPVAALSSRIAPTASVSPESVTELPKKSSIAVFDAFK